MRPGAVTLSDFHPFELPYGERAILDGLVRHISAQSIWEFGTYTGSSTVVMAGALAEGGVVETIDLPGDGAPGRQADRIGEAIRARPDLASRIVQHRCDLRQFDFRAWIGKVDLVFVDASHQYNDVLADSRIALELLSPGGVIVWDDYQAAHPGVVRALTEVGIGYPLVHVAGSRLVVHRS